MDGWSEKEQCNNCELRITCSGQTTDSKEMHIQGIKNCSLFQETNVARSFDTKFQSMTKSRI